VEIDAELAAMLTERFAGQSSVEIVQGDATALTYPDGRFSGAVSFTMLHHVPTPALQDRVFAEAARVLRSGAPLVASDSKASPEMEEHHEGDTYNPIDPDDLAPRLEAAGFIDVQVTTNPFGWTAVARRA
jgi:ubiquinone/menaquinone biosynthesis C-methylase UbiE